MSELVCVVMHNDEVIARVSGHLNVVSGGCLLLLDEQGRSMAFAAGHWDIAWEEKADE